MACAVHAADVTLEVDAPSTLSAPRDAAALQLVLRNLIDNAIKFYEQALERMPPGASASTAGPDPRTS